MSEACAEQSSEKVRVTNSEIAEMIRSNDRFLIVSHQRPDGDCIGSTMGLLLGLRALGKTVAAYNSTGLTEKWSFVPCWQEIRTSMPEWTPNVTIFVDCGSAARVRDGFRAPGISINIDHHITNDCFGDFNLIEVEACAVGEQIYNLLKELGVEVDSDIASSIYLSIMSDTGSFRYSNTSARAFHIAGEMVSAGANPGETCQRVYESKSKGEMALIAQVLNRLNYEEEETFVWSELLQADYQANGGPESEPEGLVSDIRAVNGVEVSCLMHELPNGEGIRAGWRGKGNVDCTAIAEACGGGGHFNAAGAMIRGVTYEEGKRKVLETSRRVVAEWVSKNR